MRERSSDKTITYSNLPRQHDEKMSSYFTIFQRADHQRKKSKMKTYTYKLRYLIEIRFLCPK
jgi:hypothetical protein